MRKTWIYLGKKLTSCQVRARNIFTSSFYWARIKKFFIAIKTNQSNEERNSILFTLFRIGRETTDVIFLMSNFFLSRLSFLFSDMKKTFFRILDLHKNILKMCQSVLYEYLLRDQLYCKWFFTNTKNINSC